MGGLLGVVSVSAEDDASSRFMAAAKTMQQRHCRIASSIDVRAGRWIFGQFELNRSFNDESPRVTAVEPAVLFFGVLHNIRELRGKYHLPSNEEVDSPASLIRQLYALQGARFPESLEGEFCVAVVDPIQDRILIASDAVGSHPLYWNADSVGMVFSSNLSALLRITPSARRLDLVAVADYITLGSLLGDRTLVQDVSLLAPGTVLMYDVRTQCVSFLRYFDVASLFEEKCQDKAKYLETVEEEFKCAVNRALNSSRRVGLALSGGLDSRAILSASGSRARTLQTYTLGIDGCADQVISEKLARIAGSEHRFFCLDQSYLRDFLPNMARMVSLTDGMYVSHGLTEILALQFLGETGIEVLLRGHGGELAKTTLAWPLHTDSAVYGLNSSEELASYLSERANYITRGLVLSRLLLPDAADSAGNGSRSSFRELLAGTALSPAECCSYLYLRELTRRFTIPSIELFRTSVEVRLPYLDRRFLKALLGAPSEWRDGTEIHQRLIGNGIPQLSKIRNSNTGAPADASKRSEYVFDKFNSLFKRLNVRGFRHYHNFDAWMRTMLLQSVESELLSDSAMIQSFIRKPELKKLIEDTRSGVDDRGYLLQILLILELWQRENGITC